MLTETIVPHVENAHWELGLCGDGDVDDRLPGATLGVEKVQKDLELVGAGAVAEEPAFALLLDEAFLAQRVEVVRKRRCRDAELVLKLPDDQASGMGCQEQADDGDAVFVSQGREHPGYSP